MQRFLRTLAGRSLALALCLLSGPLSCVPGDLLAPEAGVVDRERAALVPVPGGLVNTAAGNLILPRHDIDVDTPLGTWSIGATYNAATGRWTWSHRMHYDGQRFREASGAEHDVSGLPDGAPIPGTRWTRVDGDTLRTRGGLEHHFAADGLLAEVRWATLAHPRITLDAAAIALCTAPGVCLPLFAIAPGPQGQPLALTELRSGREARFDYDAQGKLVRARSPSDLARGAAGTRYEYAAGDTLLTALTTPEGERIEYRYQPGRRIDTVTQVGEGDPRHVFRFAGRTADGRYRCFHKNPLGGITRYEFDAQRRLLLTEREGTGDVVVREWNGLRPARVIAPGGAVTELVFLDDRLVQRITPSGNVVSYGHAAGGLSLDDPFAEPLARVEDALGVIVEREHDADGRPLRWRNGAGDEVEVTWLGSAVASVAEAGVVTGFSDFGVHGHWRSATIGGQLASNRAFDAIGNAAVPSVEARPGGTLGHGFDASRRVARVDRADSDAEGRVAATAAIELVRRGDGRIATIARPGGGDHVLVHDAIGRVVAVRERVGDAWQTTTIAYDAAGNQVARERPNGMREEFDYDAFGRMTRHRALQDGVLEGEEVFYWSDGRLAARYDSIRDLTEVYAYDAAGRLASTAFGHGETIAREYDARDRLVAEVFAIPGVGTIADIGHVYDAAGRLVRLEDRQTGEVLVEDRWLHGRPQQTTTGNGLVRSYQLDAQGLLSGMETRDVDGVIVETTRVERVTASAPPRFEISSVTTTPLATSEEHYWLPAGLGLANPDQRVGKRVFGWHPGGDGTVRRFAWDVLGNRRDDAFGNRFVHDATGTRLLQATQDGGATLRFTWDAAGFATARNDVPLAWTATGRLARHGDDRLVWDLAGRLVEATVDGATRRYLRFGGRVESDLTHVGWLDLGVVALHLGSGVRRYRHADFRGNVGFVSDDAGQVVAQHRYQPFGPDASWGVAESGSTFEHQPSLGALVLLGERVLDPQVGRFLSPDPVLNLVNQYAYALGNPIWFQDRGGAEMTHREAWQVGLQLLAVTVAVVAISSGVGLIPASSIVVQAALRSGAIVGAVVSVVNLVDATLSALENDAPTTRNAAPPPPPLPKPSAPPPPDVKPPQIKSLEIQVVPMTGQYCTPFGRGNAPPAWVVLLFAIAHLLAFVVWWRRGPEVSS